MKDGGAAFPYPRDPAYLMAAGTHPEKGMSLRQWYAGMALQGLLANHLTPGNVELERLRNASFALADAMLDEEEEKR